MRHWLLFDGRIWSEEILRTAGWTDEHLRPPHAYRVRERVTANEPVVNFKPTHVCNGSYGGTCTIKSVDKDICIATFSDGRVRYVSTIDIEPIPKEHNELIDDIDALCLSIEKRQNELSRLVKKLKG